MAFAHFINGRAVDTAGGTRFERTDPATGERLGEVPLESIREADEAVEAARQVFPGWAATPVGDRVQYLFRFKQVLEEHAEELAAMIVREHGKTLPEARGDVRRGIDCVEFACGAPTLMMGRSLPQIARSSSFCRTEDDGGAGIDSTADRVPIGVCVGITPFNFPVMVPLWMWPIAVACGNTFVLKPSEKVSACAAREVELAHVAGLPPGVLNMVSGGPAVVDHLLAHPDVRAISFVGSTPVARHIYATAAAHGKRAQCMAGAKNHMVILPDANRDAAIDGVIGSAFGNTGQRCLAGSVVVLVGDTPGWFIPQLLEAARAIRVDRGSAPGCGMGPLIDDAALARVHGAIDSGIEDGATLLLDGRTATLPASGSFVGPTIFDNVRPGMRLAEEEIFGPVLSIMREETLGAAIATVNRSTYGNMAVIFTSSGHDARAFATRVQAGMVGINVGVPAPMAVFPFAGWKSSFFGSLHANGEDAVRFYTEYRITVSRW